MDRASEDSSRRIYAVAAVLLLAPVYWHELEAPEETENWLETDAETEYSAKLRYDRAKGIDIAFHPFDGGTDQFLF